MKAQFENKQQGMDKVARIEEARYSRGKECIFKKIVTEANGRQVFYRAEGGKFNYTEVTKEKFYAN